MAKAPLTRRGERLGLRFSGVRNVETNNVGSRRYVFGFGSQSDLKIRGRRARPRSGSDLRPLEGIGVDLGYIIVAGRY